MEFSFRSAPTDTSLSQSSYLSRSQIPDYSSAQQQVPYTPQSRYAQPDAATSQFSDGQTSSHRVAQPEAVSRHASTAEHLQYQDVSGSDKFQYGQQPVDHSMRLPQYRQQLPNNVQGSNMLPPLSTTSASSTQAVVPSSSAYAYGPTDSRFATQGGSQINGQMRGGYGYPQTGTA